MYTYVPEIAQELHQKLSKIYEGDRIAIIADETTDKNVNSVFGIGFVGLKALIKLWMSNLEDVIVKLCFRCFKKHFKNIAKIEVKLMHS